MSFFRKNTPHNHNTEKLSIRKNTMRAAFPLAMLAIAMPLIFYLTEVAGVKVARVATAAEPSRYSEIYDIGKCDGFLCACAVGVRADSAGVDIAATDRDWREDYALGQNVAIIRNPNGIVEVIHIYKMIPKTRQGFPITIESAYDIFAVKCREDALWLPPEVKKFFFGQYGIE